MKNIDVSAAIIVKDNKVLFTQRGYGEYKDKWEFPGGKIEKGETASQTIVREIKEELDADINVDSFLCKVEHDYTSFYLIMNVFICSLKNDHILFKEHESYKWIDKSNLLNKLNLDLLPADQKVMPYLINYLNKSNL